MSKFNTAIIVVIIFLGVSIPGFSQIKPARIFSDNMVLQREVKIPVWGTAEPGEMIEVTLANSSESTKASIDGKWNIQLPKQIAGGPYKMLIKSRTDSVVLRNVLIGDVWFASGQSNMEHPMKDWEFIPHSEVNNADAEIADSNYPQIRLFSVPKFPSPVQQNDLENGTWEIAGPNSVGGFSSLAWFFAKELNQKLNVPIGIINSSWGGTPIQTWMSREMLENFKDSLKLPAIPENFNSKEWSAKIAGSLEKNRVRRMEISYPTEELPGEISDSNFNDSSWKLINLLDETSRFCNVVWLRKTIELPENMEGKTLVLSLGFLNRQSNIYWNGHELGYCQYPKPVEFVIPGSLVHSRENILAVRIAQPFGDTQAFGKPEQFAIESSDGTFLQSLTDKWSSCDNLEEISSSAENYQNNPAFLFSGMVAPIVPFALKGFIWYQGESDAGRPFLYEKMFQQLISGWRNLWQNDLPFLFVQTSNIELNHHFEQHSNSWCGLREAQSKALALPKTGMVVSVDIGNPYDVHPHNKQEFGHRLALQALKVAYHQLVNADAPVPESVQLKGDTVVVHFSTKIFISRPEKTDTLCSFELASVDGIFQEAMVILKDDQLYVVSKKVKNPVAVRYAWENNPRCCLYNEAGLPVAPFRTNQLTH